MELLVLSLLGAATGLLGALLGIGGGVFMIPMLVLYFNTPVAHAVGMGLVAVIATSNSAGSVNVGQGTVNLRLGMVLELATVLGALAGALLAGRAAPNILIGLFGILLAVFSVLMWRSPADPNDSRLDSEPSGPLDGEYFDAAENRRVRYHMKALPIGMGVSLAAGALSGLLGIGGGVFKVPVMHLYCGIPMKAAAATSNFMIGVTAAASAFLYLGRGQIPTVPTAAVVLGVLVGAWAGTTLNRKITDRAVRRAFSLLLVLLSMQMIFRAFHDA